MKIQRGHFKSECLKDGLLIKDMACDDLGLLVKRYDILDSSDTEEMWVWDIYWTGSATTETNRHSTLIEKSILTLLNMGAWAIRADHDD